MAEILINGKTYNIEPYSCSNNREFPFYINITNVCNAKCEFCVNACNKDYGKLNLEELESILDQVSDRISRISVTGGETLLYPDELEKLLKLLF